MENTGLSLFGEIVLSLGNISDIKNTKSSKKNARPTAPWKYLIQFVLQHVKLGRKPVCIYNMCV